LSILDILQFGCLLLGKRDGGASGRLYAHIPSSS